MYRLVCRDTYEAQIFKIASLKSGLDEAILGQVAASGDTVADAKKIADLLKCAGRTLCTPCVIHLLSSVQNCDDDEGNSFCSQATACNLLIIGQHRPA